MNVNIRKAALKDAESIVELSKELGYNPGTNDIRAKLDKFELSPHEMILVAEYDKVIGWMHISTVEPLESNPFVEIRGIVVYKEHRGKGIGTLLIKEAEKWAIEKGVKKLRVRTNIKREETRQYYRKLDFVPVKTQEVFEKKIIGKI